MFRLPSDVADHLGHGGTLVVPSRQRAYAVRLAHASAALGGGQRVWPSADVLGAESWLRREVEHAAGAEARWPRVLTGAEEWFLWRECAREATHGLALLDGGALADSLREAEELTAEFRIRPPGASPDSEAALLAQVGRAFAERCRALGAGSVSALAERILEPPPGPNRPLLLRGFGTLTPRLRALTAARGARDAGGKWVLSSRLAAEPQVLRAADGREELERIAQWCRGHLERQADARLLVMLPGKPGTRERLAALIRQAVDPAALFGEVGSAQGIVGIEGGRPLGEQPMIRHALETLTWLQGEEGSFAALSGWLRSPHWQTPSAPARAALDLSLRERGILALDLRELLGALQLAPRALRGAARELSTQLTRARSVLGETPSASPRVWSERVSAALALAGWPGSATEHGDGQQTVLRWHELLEEFGELTPSTGVLEREPALRLLSELAARSPFRGADEDVSVTLSARLADPVLEYDGIWVGGLQADCFPQPVAPNPFLPLAAQVAAHVPSATASGRLTEAQELLAAWRAATPELVLSAPRHEKDMELVPSPLLSGATLEPPPEQGGWLPFRVHREALTESILDQRGRPWVPSQPLPRGTRTLDLQNQCPFRAYAELRLGSSRPEPQEPGVAAHRRGELLHAALAALWGRLRDSNTLASLSAARLEELISACVAEAVRTSMGASPGRRARRAAAESQLDLFAEIPAALARESRRAVRLIGELCELERIRSPFRVAGIEQEAELALAGARLRMRIDRVDAFAGGGRAILDYKSGRRLVPDWYGERPTYPQLLAYLAALGADVAALATVSVNAREVRFDAIAREAGMLPGAKAVDPEEGWAGRQAAWLHILERLIGGFLEGDAAIEPKPGVCSSCHVTDICRILERTGESALAGGAHE